MEPCQTQLCEYKKQVKFLSQFKGKKSPTGRFQTRTEKAAPALETLLKQTNKIKHKQSALDVTHEPPRSSCLFGKCARAVCVNAAAR